MFSSEDQKRILADEAAEWSAALQMAFPNLTVETEASAIAGSPFPYVYVWMTGKRFDGPHLCVSARREVEDSTGLLVGYYPEGNSYEEPGDVVAVESTSGMIEAARGFVEAASR